MTGYVTPARPQHWMVRISDMAGRPLTRHRAALHRALQIVCPGPHDTLSSRELQLDVDLMVKSSAYFTSISGSVLLCWSLMTGPGRGGAEPGSLPRPARCSFCPDYCSLSCNPSHICKGSVRRPGELHAARTSSCRLRRPGYFQTFY